MEIRDLDPADLDAAFDIRTRSFGMIPDARRQTWGQMMQRAMAARLVLACYDGVELLAVARINRFSQWWQGRSLPMAGIGGVVVAPEHRSRGVGTLLMTAVLERAASGGFALSALYPSTAPVYRGCGWEFAGSHQAVTLPAEALRSLSRPTSAGPVPVRRVGPEDAAEILEVVRGVHATARDSGPIDWDEPEVRAWLTDDQPFTYLAGDGFLAYHWEGSELEVDELVAGSGETARALWSLVGSGSSVLRATVKAYLGPHDPVRLLTRESVVRHHEDVPWMLRLVDVPAALTDRGYPAGIDTELTLAVDDPQLPGNSGTWRLTVAKRAGRAERVAAGRDVLRLGPRGLAALYAGTPLPTLRAAGLATGGDPDTDPVLDAVFSANPYLIDYF